MNKSVVFLLLAAFLVLLPACTSSSSGAEDGKSILWDAGAGDGFGGSLPSGSANLGNFAGAPPAPGSPGSEAMLPIRDLALGPNTVISGTADSASPSLAQISLEVESVPGATAQVQAIAQSVGGYVERLSSAGGSQKPRADVIVKIPQVQLTAAMERIEALGDVQFRSLGAEDVTGRHIDLAARLATYRKEEQSLTSLVERAGSVGELLSVERELARVRAGIERTQAQLDLLERQVDMATVHVTLLRAGIAPAGFATASFTLSATDIPARITELREYVAGRRGVVDQFYLSSSDDEERAEVVFRVFADDFNRSAQFVERQGQVTARQILERRDPSGREGSQARRPDSRIHVAYVDSSTDVNLWIPILIIVGVLVLAGAVAYLMRQAYTRGRSRGSFM